MSTETAVQPPPSSAAPASRWEDFVDVFLSPSELFRRRASDSWTVPLIVLSVLGVALYYGFLPVNKVMTEVAMTSNPNMTPEQRQAALGMARTFQLLGGIFVPIFMVVMILIAAFISWLAGKATSIDLPFKRALTINTFIGFLTLVQQLVTGVLLSLKLRSGAELDPIKDASFGVLRFLQPADMNQAVVALVGRIDLFAFWQFAWIGIALIAACKAPRGAAWTAAAILWLAGSLPMLIRAAFQ